MDPKWIACLLTVFYAMALARWLLRRRSSPPSSSSSSLSLSNHAHTNGNHSTTTTQPEQRLVSTGTMSGAPSPSLMLRPPGKPFNVAYRYAVAPMVGQCDLPFRMQCRAGGSQLVYSPMFFADRFATDAAYRRSVFHTCDTDRPLAVQFGGNDAKILLQAARFVENHCDAVDLNLGCPQQRASEGHYGAYLLPKANWPRILDMVGICHRHLRIPIICKIRLLPDLNETIQLCKLLEAAGCSLIAVHGRRLAGDRKRRVGPANLEAIRRIKAALTIPVLSNGNVRRFNDVTTNLRVTAADGIMSGEAILANPSLFNDVTPDPFTHCDQYFAACARYGTPPLKWVADHAKNFIRPLRQRGVARAMDDLRALARDQPLRQSAATPASSSTDTTSTTFTTTSSDVEYKQQKQPKHNDSANAAAAPANADTTIVEPTDGLLLWGTAADAVITPVRNIIEALKHELSQQQQQQHDGGNNNDNSNSNGSHDNGDDDIWPSIPVND